MRFAVLGSGSGGNSTVIECGGRYLLIDAGLSAKQLNLRLSALGVDSSKLVGVLLTHEHGDHVRGLDVFLRKCPVPVVASVMTGRVVQEKLRERVNWVSFESGQKFEWEGFDISTFALPHDAVEPVGFVVKEGERSVGVATDLGHVNDGVLAALRGVEGLVVEANYEWAMLEADLRRPFSTKQRISSKHGHLSNEQAGELVSKLAEEGLRKVILGHLSSDCNSPEKAVEVVGGMVGAGGPEICVALQDQVTSWQCLQPPVDPGFFGELFQQKSVSRR